MFLNVKNYLQCRKLYLSKLQYQGYKRYVHIYKVSALFLPRETYFTFLRLSQMLFLCISLDFRKYLYENSNKILLNRFFYFFFLLSFLLFFSNIFEYLLSIRYVLIDRIQPALIENIFPNYICSENALTLSKG